MRTWKKYLAPVVVTAILTEDSSIKDPSKLKTVTVSKSLV